MTRTARLTRVIVVVVLLALARWSRRAWPAASRPVAGSTAGVGAVRRLRRAAVGRAAVLRLRRLRADRHDGRGGARSRTDDPARDPARARPGVVRVRGGRRSTLLLTLGPDATRRIDRAARRRRRLRRLEWAVPVVRVGARGRGPRRAARAHRGHRAHTLAMAREGRPAPPLAAVHPRCRVPHRAEVAVAVASRRWCSPSTCAARSASRRSACCSTTSSRTSPRSPSRPTHRRWPRALQVVGAARLPHPGRHPALDLGGGRRLRARGRRPVPGGAAAHDMMRT